MNLADIERLSERKNQEFSGEAHLTNVELDQLLALAREHMRLLSALEFLGHRSHHVINGHGLPQHLTVLLPREILKRATEAGWTFDAPEQAKEEA